MTAQEIICAQIRGEISEDEATARLVEIYERGEKKRLLHDLRKNLAYTLACGIALALFLFIKWWVS